MNSKKNYNKSLKLNQKSNYDLMNNYGDIKLGSDVFNYDLISMNNSIDYDKDDFFDRLEKIDKTNYFS